MTQLRLFARPKTVTWRCPRCDYTTVQPRRVVVYGHLCGIGRHLVRLERVDDDD